MSKKLIMDEVKSPRLIVLGVPSCRDYKPQFVISLVNTLLVLGGAGYRVQFYPKLQTSLLPLGREQLLSYAEGEDALLLFCDDDMQFEPEAVLRLLKTMGGEGKGAAMVCANYSKKTPEGKTVARGAEGPLLSDRNPDDLSPVTVCGLGLALIETRLTRDIPAPRFPVGYDPAIKSYTSEDYNFCQLLSGKGLSIYVDNRASELVDHIGDYPYYVFKD